MSYIIETFHTATRTALGDQPTIYEARAACEVAMSVAPPAGPDFAFAIDEDGHYVVALERTGDGRIIDHLHFSPAQTSYSA